MNFGLYYSKAKYNILSDSEKYCEGKLTISILIRNSRLKNEFRYCLLHKESVSFHGLQKTKVILKKNKVIHGIPETK